VRSGGRLFRGFFFVDHSEIVLFVGRGGVEVLVEIGAEVLAHDVADFVGPSPHGRRVVGIAQTVRIGKFVQDVVVAAESTESADAAGRPVAAAIGAKAGVGLGGYSHEHREALPTVVATIFVKRHSVVIMAQEKARKCYLA